MQPASSWKYFFPEWLANPVLVLKKNKQWRMCIDYTSLNKACPKDPFALPRIDQVIDSTAGCELLSFLDAYSGYHQIKLNPADRLKTAFIKPFGDHDVRLEEDCLHQTIRSLLLPDNDVRLEECRRHLLALHAEVPPQATRQKCPRLRG